MDRRRLSNVGAVVEDSVGNSYRVAVGNENFQRLTVLRFNMHHKFHCLGGIEDVDAAPGM